MPIRGTAVQNSLRKRCLILTDDLVLYFAQGSLCGNDHSTPTGQPTTSITTTTHITTAMTQASCCSPIQQPTNYQWCDDDRGTMFTPQITTSQANSFSEMHRQEMGLPVDPPSSVGCFQGLTGALSRNCWREFCHLVFLATITAMTNWRSNHGIMDNAARLARVMEYIDISKWWFTILSSCRITISSTIALWIVPSSFALFCVVSKFLESLITVLHPTGVLLDRSIGAVEVTKSIITASREFTILDQSATTLIPKIEGLVLLVLTTVILMSIGSFFSCLERQFLDTRTEQNLSPVVKTRFASEDLAQCWIRYEKLLLTMMVFRIA